MPSVFCGSPGVLFPRRRLVPGGYLDRRRGCEAEREECWFSRKVSRGWVPVPLAQPRLPTRLPEVYYRARSGLENSRVGPTAPGHFGECLGILMQSLMRESYFISRALALTLTC